MPEPITLLEDASPTAPVTAIVETDGTTVYLYLHGDQGSRFGTRALWVANLSPAPDGVDTERMKRGEAPRMPSAGTARPEGVRLADLEPLKLIWFPEGTGVALAGKDGLLAILPPGATENDTFPGFARDATQRTRLAWPLSSAEGLVAKQRAQQAEAFWSSWDTDDAWPAFQRQYVAAIDAALGADGHLYPPQGTRWPPRFCALRRVGTNTVLITGGVSILPQPGVARAPGQPVHGARRIELALGLTGHATEEALSVVARWLMAQSQLPWMRASWLGHGHTLGCDILPVGHSGVRFPAVLLAENPSGAPAIALPARDGEAVHLLWLLPITDAERTLAVQKGSAALLERLGHLGELWAHRDRADAGVSN